MNRHSFSIHKIKPAFFFWSVGPLKKGHKLKIGDFDLTFYKKNHAI